MSSGILIVSSIAFCTYPINGSFGAVTVILCGNGCVGTLSPYGTNLELSGALVLFSPSPVIVILGVSTLISPTLGILLPAESSGAFLPPSS